MIFALLDYTDDGDIEEKEWGRQGDTGVPQSRCQAMFL